MMVTDFDQVAVLRARCSLTAETVSKAVASTKQEPILAWGSRAEYRGLNNCLCYSGGGGSLLL